MTETGKIHSALKDAGLEYAALSWNGFNLFGDRKSIEEAKRLLHNSDDVLPIIRDQLCDIQRLSFDWMKKHDRLLGFIQKHPALLKELIEAARIDGQ